MYLYIDKIDLFSSNQLSRFALKSMWSPKFPGRVEVVKY